MVIYTRYASEEEITLEQVTLNQLNAQIDALEGNLPDTEDEIFALSVAIHDIELEAALCVP